MVTCFAPLDFSVVHQLMKRSTLTEKWIMNQYCMVYYSWTVALEHFDVDQQWVLEDNHN